MKILKSILPFFLILIVKIFIDVSYHGNRDLLYLISITLYTYLPYYITLIFAKIYLNKNKIFKNIILILLGFVTVLMVLNMAPIYMEILFNISLGYMFNISLSKIIFIGFAILILVHSILSKNTFAIVASIIALLVVLYTELIFITGLDFNPYTELVTLYEHGLYKSMLRSFLTIILIWINVFMSFYALNLGKSK